MAALFVSSTSIIRFGHRCRVIPFFTTGGRITMTARHSAPLLTLTYAGFLDNAPISDLNTGL